MLLLSLLGCLLADLWVKAVCESPKSLLSSAALIKTPGLSAWAPLRLVWASSLWQIIGGGAQVASSLFFVIIADVLVEQSRYTLSRLSLRSKLMIFCSVCQLSLT